MVCVNNDDISLEPFDLHEGSAPASKVTSF